MNRSAIAAGLAVAGLVVLPVVPATAVDSVLCQNVGDDLVSTSDPSLSLDLIGIQDAQDLLGGPAGAGAGVNVAVLDSGISRQGGGVDIAGGTVLSRGGKIQDPHGTAVASLIAGTPRPDGGLVGVAPGAGVLDVRVYDTTEQDSPDGEPPTSAALAAGLRWVADNAATSGIRIANVSLSVAPSDELEAAVAAAQAAGVVVVAETGNRGTSGPMEAHPSAVPGEDVGRDVFPAGYDGVIGVNATAGGAPEGTDALQNVAASSATDLAAPTYGSVVLAVNGSTCTLQDISSGWAAAEVSGVLALLWSRYPRDDADQITARLLNTASGTTDDPTKLTGVGIVQPMEALTRPVVAGANGSVSDTRSARDENPRARAPEPEVDTLASLRHTALWVAILGGAALLLALMLRPVLARRRD
ncbi:MAG: S8 family serine peptidase [Nocardioides sp.]